MSCKCDLAIFSFSVSIQYSYKCNLAIFSDKLIGLVLEKGFIALTKANTLELASYKYLSGHELMNIETSGK